MPKLNPYNCRHPNSANLKILLPGETRREKFCPDCPHGPYKGQNCLFKSRRNEPVKLQQRWANARKQPEPRVTQEQMIEAIIKRWLEIDRPPLITDLKRGISGQYIAKLFPGGFVEARRQAAEQAGLELVFNCLHCGKPFATPQRRSVHQRRCRVSQAELERAIRQDADEDWEGKGTCASEQDHQ